MDAGTATPPSWKHKAGPACRDSVLPREPPRDGLTVPQASGLPVGATANQDRKFPAFKEQPMKEKLLIPATAGPPSSPTTLRSIENTRSGRMTWRRGATTYECGRMKLLQ